MQMQYKILFFLIVLTLALSQEDVEEYKIYRRTLKKVVLPTFEEVLGMIGVSPDVKKGKVAILRAFYKAYRNKSARKGHKDNRLADGALEGDAGLEMGLELNVIIRTDMKAMQLGLKPGV